jgi:hypothetical protein
MSMDKNALVNPYAPSRRWRARQSAMSEPDPPDCTAVNPIAALATAAYQDPLGLEHCGPDTHWINLFDSIPSRVRTLIEAGCLERSLPELALGFVAGDGIEATLWDRLAGHLATFFNSYGPAETAMAVPDQSARLRAAGRDGSQSLRRN